MREHRRCYCAACESESNVAFVDVQRERNRVLAIIDEEEAQLPSPIRTVGAACQSLTLRRIRERVEGGK